MYAAPTEEMARLVAVKDTQKSPGTLQGRKALLILAAEVPRRTTDKVRYTPTWRTVKSSMGKYHFFL